MKKANSPCTEDKVQTAYVICQRSPKSSDAKGHSAEWFPPTPDPRSHLRTTTSLTPVPHTKDLQAQITQQTTEAKEFFPWKVLFQLGAVV